MKEAENDIISHNEGEDEIFERADLNQEESENND